MVGLELDEDRGDGVHDGAHGEAALALPLGVVEARVLLLLLLDVAGELLEVDDVLLHIQLATDVRPVAVLQDEVLVLAVLLLLVLLLLLLLLLLLRANSRANLERLHLHALPLLLLLVDGRLGRSLEAHLLPQG